MTLGCIFKIQTDGTIYSHIIDSNSIFIASSPTSLSVSGNTLFGCAGSGGSYNKGCIFKINKDGSGAKKLFDFDGVNGQTPYFNTAINDSIMYGVAIYYIGSLPRTSIFKIDTNGTGFANIYIDSLAYTPSVLTLSGNILYGTANAGGTNNKGFLFKLNTDGTGYTKLFDFDGTTSGYSPRSPLIVSGNVLYGTTYMGGANGFGTIFKINTDGSGYVKLLDFYSSIGGDQKGNIVLSGNTIYGTSEQGGANLLGDIWSINTNGIGFLKLFDFNATTSGVYPDGGLTLVGNTLYGTTRQNSSTSGYGNLFSINTNGTGFSVLYDFNNLSGLNGAGPQGYVIYSDGVLYGTTSGGGVNSNGVIFQYGGITTNVNDIPLASEYYIFPNPSSDFIFIKNADNIFKNVKIVDISGRTLIEDKIIDEQINISSLASGIYILKIENSSFKFIKY